MQRIGVLGVGHFGKFHVKAVKDIPDYELAGFYDINEETSASVQKEFQIHRFPDYETMLANVDIVDIVVPTVSHYSCAIEALRRQKHVFIEKPVTHTIEDANGLLKLAEEASVKVQVGHIERFNPAFIAAQPYLKNPKFIEIHRLQPFTNRSTDVSVILNLMIHDIDIVLSTVHSNLKKISASGVQVLTDSIDMANARLEFDNGCVANITASRIAKSNVRRSRFFQKDMSVTIDFLNKKTEIIRTDLSHNDPGSNENFITENPEVIIKNSIQEELQSFLTAINHNTNPLVTLDDGVKALKIAFEIIEKIKLSNVF
jgi:predicted dehydrogenase